MGLSESKQLRRNWNKVSFEEGESPADGEGQNVYELQFLDGTTLDYYYCGQESYIRMDGIWYKIKNPKLPPVGEPAFWKKINLKISLNTYIVVL